MAAQVISMYDLSPISDPSSKLPDLPTCMYNMRSYYQSNDEVSKWLLLYNLNEILVSLMHVDFLRYRHATNEN